MPGLEPFRDELPIPDTVHATERGGRRRVVITAQVASVRLHATLPPTTTWSYRLTDGELARAGRGATYLGPTIEVARGEEISVTWTNGIDAGATLPFEVVRVPNVDAKTTIPVPQNVPGRDGALPDAQDPGRRALRNVRAALVTHLHGGRTQSYSDGWPDDTVVRGQSLHYSYENDQASAMLWYHDHSMHITRLNVYAGLAGVWLIRDDEDARLSLPDGPYELPLVIQDRNLDVDDGGRFTGALLHKIEVGDGPMEFFGPYSLVNGVIWPKATVEPRLYRLRVLNAANARTFRFSLLDESGRAVHDCLTLIGCDQGLMERVAPIPADGLLLAPAERVDLLVDFGSHSGQRLYLWNTAEAPFGNDATQLPDGDSVARELRALLRDPLASAADLDKRNAIARRPFPQVMRFDIVAAAGASSHRVPRGRLWSGPHEEPVVDEHTPVRIMALVEEPTAEDAGPAATSMLVFWEYVPADERPAPPGITPVSFTYWHPGREKFETREFWKAAAYFYDSINWHVRLGATELWYIVNLSPDTHPIHVHLTHFSVHQRWRFAWNGEGELDPSEMTLTRVEATDALPIPPEVRGPKDTVRVDPGEMVGIVLRFAPYPGRYMYHCHILEHEDHDMMRPFVVVPSWVPLHDTAHHMVQPAEHRESHEAS